MKYLASLLFSALSAWLVARYAPKLNLIDSPTGRSSHAIPTPKGGGIGILVGFLIGSVGLLPVFFWLPACFLSLVSLKNDIADISPRGRLVVQFAAALVVVLSSVPCGYGVWTIFTLILLAFYVLFIVATTNFYNFMDGINGIASLMGIVSFSLLGFFLQASHKDFGSLCFGMAISCLGFLPFNLIRAKVFMGDVGSILLGFIFSSVVVLTVRSSLDLLVMSSFLLLFYLDELLSMVKRIRVGQSLLVAHRGHLYQILVNEVGFAHWKVATGYALVQLLIGVFTIWLKTYGILIVVLDLLIFSVVFYSFDSFIKRRYCKG